MLTPLTDSIYELVRLFKYLLFYSFYILCFRDNDIRNTMVRGQK